MSRTRVVVTGLGATTPLGGDVASTWEAMLAGKSGVARIEADWADDLAVKIAAVAAVDPTEVLDRVEARRLDRSAQLGVIAAMEAWRDAGYGLGEDNPVDRDTARRRHRHRHRRPADPARQLGRPEGEGLPAGQPAGHPDADGQRHGRQRQPAARRPGRRPHPGLGLRLQQRGHLPRPGHDPARPRRRRRGRRHRGLHPPDADGLLRPDAGDEPPQRRARARLAALGRRPRRLRARRGRGDPGDRDPRARAGPRRPDLRRAGRRRHHRRRPRHGAAQPAPATPRPWP